MLSENMNLGGNHDVTCALANVLAATGMKNPYTNEPFTEEMILGIGGGLGAGYILWEFKQEASAIIVLGFRNRWNYPVDYLSTTCDRLGIRYTIQETSGKKAATRNLQDALETGRPFLMWIDKAHLPHQQLPESLQGYGSHLVGVHGYDEAQGALVVDDLASNLFVVPMDAIIAGRARIVSDKNRLMLLEPTGNFDLKASIVTGIHDCIQHLGRDSQSFALPVYQKWAKLMTNTKNKKGWFVVFKECKGLYNTLRSIYEGILLDNTEGAGLRSMYADFLDEAADVLANNALSEVATQYRDVASKWVKLAHAALPDEVPEFKETRNLMQKRYDSISTNQFDEMRDVTDRLLELQVEMNATFPVVNVGDLFLSLQEKLMAVYDAEVLALDTLRQVIRS